MVTNLLIYSGYLQVLLPLSEKTETDGQNHNSNRETHGTGKKFVHSSILLKGLDAIQIIVLLGINMCLALMVSELDIETYIEKQWHV